jgi:hypothetical protein
MSYILQVHFNPQEVGEFLLIDTFLPFLRDSTSVTLTYRPSDTIWWMNRLSRTIFNNVISIAESNKIWKKKLK